MRDVPVACTLDAADAATRVARWRALDAVARERSPGRLSVRYRQADGVVEELRALAAAEQECCGFLTWTVTAEDGPRLVVTGADDAVDTVAAW